MLVEDGPSVGLVLTPGAVTLAPHDLAQLVQDAEDAGYARVWLTDHPALPAQLPATYPYNATGEPPLRGDTPWHDPFALAGFLAGVTTTIEIALGVLILPIRHPLSTARSAASVDHLSSGRLVLGIGVGWLEDEFTALGEPFGNRGSRADEILEILHLLWSGDPVTYEGAHYEFSPRVLRPLPSRRPHPPILGGGESARALLRAASRCDGWIGMGHTPESVRAPIRELTSLRAERARSEVPFEIDVHVPTPPTAEVLEEFAEAGVHHVKFCPWWESGDSAELDEMRATTARFGNGSAPRPRAGAERHG